MNVKKNANVMSNDELAPTLPINFSCKVVPDTDTVSTIVFGPSLLEFSPEYRKHQIFFENAKDTAGLSVRPIGYVMDEFEFKHHGKDIGPGKKGKIDIEWKGNLPEYNVERSITFETGSAETPRFTIAYSIKGTKGQKPTPPPPVKPAQASTRSTTSRPDMPRPVVGGSTTTRPQTATTKADSIRNENPLDQKQWPPK
jgi:hypothetical protein